MSTGSAWNPKLQCKNSLALDLTTTNRSSNSLALQVRNALTGQVHQKYLLQLPEMKRLMKEVSAPQAQQGQASLQAKAPKAQSGEVSWKVITALPIMLCMLRQLRAWLLILCHAFKFWVTFSLEGVPLRCKELSLWFIWSIGSIAFVDLSWWSISATQFVWVIDVGQWRYCRLGAVCTYARVNIIVS